MSSLPEFWDIVINEIQSALVIHNDNIQNTWQKKNGQHKIFETNKSFVLYDISNHSFKIP